MRLRRHLRFLGTAAATLGWVSVTAAEPDTEDGSPGCPSNQCVVRTAELDPLDEVREAIEELADRGLRPQPEALRVALLEAVVRAADEGGSLMTGAAFKAFEMSREGKEWGMGARFAQTNGHTWVSEVFDGGAAARMLRVGDQVTELAGRFTTDIHLDVQTEWVRASTGGVSVSVLRDGGANPLEYTIEPAVVQLPAVAAEETLPGGIRLIVIRGFWSGAGHQVVRAWNAAASSGGPGVILDLRVAGGECPLAAAEAAALALPQGGDGIEFESLLDGRRTAHSGALHDVRVAGPTMLLVGPGTEGAAEVFAAALKARGRHVMLLGQPTAGDPCIREPVSLGDDRWMRVASRRLRVGGEPAETPVHPHIAVDEGKGNGAALRAARSAERIAMNPRRRALDDEAVDDALLLRVGDDAVLERAVDMLRALEALHP